MVNRTVSRYVPKELGKTLTELCAQHNQPLGRASGKLKRGWSLEEALGLAPRVSPAVARKRTSTEPINLQTPYTQAGLNIMQAAAGLLTGEEYLKKEGAPPAPPGAELGARKRTKYKRRRKTA